MRREKPDFLEVNYSLGDREAEKRLLPAAAELGIAVLADLPFARGRLFRAVKGRTLLEWASEFHAASWAQFFLKYLIAHPAVTAVIKKAMSATQLSGSAIVSVWSGLRK